LLVGGQLYGLHMSTDVGASVFTRYILMLLSYVSASTYALATPYDARTMFTCTNERNASPTSFA
jgi:hypothetical protein